ncbi:hypothetical protein ACFY8B_02520 [Streptomyces sp. NPDC012751]|uniref:hypothetical protein n=1 Tax=Streptomyces sp. NPDC012751 TaxID=3364846 RepID=UPI0036C78B8C
MGLSRLVVGEPVTDAGKCAPGPVRMVVRVAESAAGTEVWNSVPALPAPEPADPRRVGRHDPEIVRAVARGFAVRGDAGGRRVIARIPPTGTRTPLDAHRPPRHRHAVSRPGRGTTRGGAAGAGRQSFGGFTAMSR